MTIFWLQNSQDKIHHETPQCNGDTLVTVLSAVRYNQELRDGEFQNSSVEAHSQMLHLLRGSYVYSILLLWYLSRRVELNYNSLHISHLRLTNHSIHETAWKMYETQLLKVSPIATGEVNILPRSQPPIEPQESNVSSTALCSLGNSG